MRRGWRPDPARAAAARSARSSRWRLTCLLLGLAPAVVVIAERSLPLASLLLLPVVAVGLAERRALQAEREAVERERARAQAAAEAMLRLPLADEDAPRVRFVAGSQRQ